MAGSLGKFTPAKPSPTMYWVLVGSLIVFSLIQGYGAGLQPPGAQWRLFSWHPFLMTAGMVGAAGVGAVTKKMGGYTNTKIHAILSWLSVFMSGGGLYCIYKNKELTGKLHLQTPHAIVGAGVFLSCLGLGLVGSVFLHPDFGIDKTNKTIRLIHKTSARVVLIASWFTALAGLAQLNSDPMTLAMYGFPLLALIPFTLM